MTVPNGEILTRRLHLRRPVEADASAIVAIAGDWEVARRLGRVPHPYTQEDFRVFMEHVVPSEQTWAIVVRRSDELVGVISLVPHGESRSAELGYYVGRSHWGQGLATEAAQAIVRMGLEDMGYAKLTSRYHADNPASGREGICRERSRATLSARCLQCRYWKSGRSPAKPWLHSYHERVAACARV